jgi:mannose/cellobiose epimerase-like protein (N-acyl-D-glucosamine 2-epimerase family)
LSQPDIRFEDVRSWIFDKALPLWAGAGLDRERGGSVEVLDLQGADGGAHFKRTRVQARQVYAFSQAHLLGWSGPGLEAADHCWRFLAANGRHEDGAWARRLGREGGMLDPTVDAYDMAFVLYALAWRLRTGHAGALSEAHATMDALDRRLGLGPGLGWRSAEDVVLLDQNPHMHLLEASLELADAAGDDRFAQVAKDVLILFRDRMFDAGLGILPEKFEPGWNPVHGPQREVWPGHHYEWAWLLHRARDVVGLDLTDQAKALYAFAERHGPDPRTRLVDDGLQGEDMVRQHKFRCWPQAEALKAHLAMFEHQGLDTRLRIAETVSQMLDLYLGVEPAGSWQDRFGGNLEPLARDAPASMLYHLLLAFLELLRLEPLLCGPPPAR